MGKKEEEVCKLWKAVKDRLSFPLLADICLKNWLPLPACFVLFLVHLKIKVLKLIPGVDVTCSELRYLLSDNEL